MAKLVLYLPDGSLHDILLDKERLTVGRRPDNDVCLPYPAVSGEHAAVVTILADSFLEDLGSTNGTLVNGKPVVKHFLRDNDHIDIGRQRLVYFSNDETQAVPLLPDALRHEVRGLADQVERVRERRGQSRKAAKPPAPGPTSSAPEADLIDEDLFADIESSAAQDAAADPAEGRPSESGDPPSLQVGRPRESGDPASFPRAKRDTSTVASRHASTWSPDAETAHAAPPDAASPQVTVDDASEAPDAPDALVGQPEADPLLPTYRVRVLSGPSEGREVVLNRPEISVGRVGTQVACLSVQSGRWLLSALEGPAPPLLNGRPVPAVGAPLEPGDRIRVAGTDLVFEER